MQKLAAIISAVLLFSALQAKAEKCPTVEDIKKNKLDGWKIVDSDDGKPISSKRLSQFKESVVQFVLAEWGSTRNLNNAIHCYYRDKEGYSFDAYLTKDHFIPENSKKLWYTVSGSMQCAANMEQCQFQMINAKPTQLAKR